MSGYETILNLVNATNPIQQPLTKDDISFSEPIPVKGPDYNTKITISSVPGSRYTGFVDVFYNRPSLDDLNNSVINNIISDVPFTPQIIIDLLNSSRDTEFTLSDLIHCPCPPDLDVGEVASVKIAVKSNCLTWIGDANVSVLYGLPSNIGELHHLLNHVCPNDGYLIYP